MALSDDDLDPTNPDGADQDGPNLTGTVLPGLPLPEPGDDELEGQGMDDEGGVQLAVFDGEDGDPFDDALAHDVPLDIVLGTDQDEPTVIGDDALGAGDDGGHDGVDIAEGGSLIDSGDEPADHALALSGDEQLGIDPIPPDLDDGGAEGVDDPAGESVDTDLPPLDGEAEDDDSAELDVALPMTPSAD